MVYAVVGDLIRRLEGAGRIHPNSEVAAMFAILSVPDALADAWRSRLVGLLRNCGSATHGEEHGANTPEIRFSAALRSIRSRFTDPSLRLHEVAKQAHMSVWHTGRILKRETGEGFRAHLHRRRVEEGRRLLVSTDMPIKEIAVRVGYRESAPFCRQFRRLSRVSPTAYRALHIST